MIGTIRKHQQWLWAIIITLTIISFLFFFSPSQKMGGGGRSDYDFGSINGETITRDQYLDARKEATLLYYLRFHDWPGRDDMRNQFGFDMDREIYNRLMLVQKLKDLNVHISPEVTAEWISQVLHGGPEQPFSIELYNGFVKQTLMPQGMTADDFDRFARHQVGQQHLVSVFGLAGRLLPPQEAQELYVREHQPVAADLVVFSATNYFAGIAATTPILERYYSNNLAQYFVPERMQVKYVKFPLAAANVATNDTELLAKLKESDPQFQRVTNLAQVVDAIYKQRGTNYYHNTNGVALTEEAARPKVKEELRDEIARLEERKKASVFINELFGNRDETKMTAADLEKFATQKGMKVGVSEPFDQETGPKDLKLGAGFAQEAFKLSPLMGNVVATRPAEGDDAIYVVAFDKRIPRSLQSLESIRAKVTDDFKKGEGLAQARRAASEFVAAVTNGLAQKKTFEAIAAQQRAKPVALPPFSMSTRTLTEAGESISLNVLKEAVFTLPDGGVSPANPTADGAFVVRLRNHLPVDQAEMKVEFPEYLKRLRDERQVAAYSEWFQKQMQQSRLVMPASRQQNQKGLPNGRSS